ncbi:AtpZ/AtpI family protein [Bernardetia sp. OM2101]|uniref:AtpZ/AtpI family protein n=1 Tax=Bernardetia sp. OM2101 TaxID=3344876 RepID=UPI0035D06852
MNDKSNKNQNENSKHQDNSENNSSDEFSSLKDKFYQELKETEYKLDREFEEELDRNFTTDKIHTETSIEKIEPETTFKNSYTEKINVASKKREEALQKGSNKYIKYSSIGMEMIGAVLLGGFGGNWLDKKMELGFPLFTISLVLIGLGAAFTHLILQLNADRKEEDEKAKQAKINS